MLALFRLLTRWSPRLVLLGGILSVVGGAANAAVLAQINDAIAGRERNFGRFVLFCAIAALARLSAQSMLLRLSQQRIFGFRLELSRALLRAPLRRVEELGPAKIHATLVDDILRVNHAMDAMPRALTHVAVTFACLAYLALVSLKTLLPVVLVLAVALGVHVLITYVGRPYVRAYRAAQTALFALVRGMTDGLKELKLHGRRRNAFVHEGLNPNGLAYAENAGRVDQLSLVSSLLGFVVTAAVIGVLLFVYDSGSSRIASAYVLALLFMQPHIEGLVAMLPVFDQAAAVLKNLDEIGLAIRSRVEAETDPAPAPAWKTLCLTDVSYSYNVEGEGQVFTLGPVSASFCPGEIVFIVGGNGSGKSSFVKLLTGLYAPDSGTIAVGGDTVDTAASGWYREMFSAVFADFHLFDHLYGLRIAASPDKVDRYLTELHLSRKVQVRDGKFSTVSLSSGQRKRLALLVAYLEDRPVYVFDEWASDQDPSYKATFYRQILPELKRRGKCVIVVSHDDRYFDVADRVLTLDEGKLRSTWSGSGRPVAPLA